MSAISQVGSAADLLAACREHAANDLRLRERWVPNSVHPDHGVIDLDEMALLSGLAALVEPSRIIETGSYSGSSAGLFSWYCDDVWSIDTGDYFQHEGFRSFYGPQAIAPGFTLPHQLRHDIHFVWGVGYEKILRLGGSDRILFFHDSDHSYESIIAELGSALRIGVKAIAVHDVNYDPDARAAWADWDAPEVRVKATSDTFWGLGIAIL